METLKKFIAVAALLASLSGFAVKETVNGITWTLGWVDVHSTNVGGGTSSSTAVPTSTTGDITIPSTFGVYSVTGIGDYAFYNCSGLTSVTIPYSVTSIGSYAFYGCSGLTGVNIPSGVTSIGSSAFYNCTNLTSATIPNKVTSIGSSVFYGCSGLTSVTIGDWVASIAPYAFYGCGGLKSVTMGGGVTSIESSAFYNCTNLTSVTIPNSVTGIGNYAFSGCSGLTSVSIPYRVTSIGPYAFSGCSGLTSVSISASVTSIDFSAFSGCSGLTSVSIPQCVCGSRLSSVFSAAYQSITNVVIRDGVTSIGSYAFEGCGGLTSVTIPSSVTNIGSHAFEDCSGLTSVAIPSSVTSIGSSAFSGCSGLMSILVADGNANYLSANGLLLTNDGKTLIKGVNGAVTIPDGVETIGSSAFSDCSCLTSVTIPNSVTNIASYAFKNCSGLTSVTIGDGVTSIGSSAFYGCSGLTSVTIGDGVTSIGSSAFFGCSGLYDTNSILGVKLVDGWVVGYTSLPFGDLDLTDVRGIASYAFKNCSGLTSVTIPDGVTSIGDSAFYGCSGLTSVTMPDGVTSIGSYAFEGCGGLTSVTIPSSVTNIGDRAFYNCSGIRDVAVSQYICTNRLSSVFPSAYKSITNVVICDGVTSIGSSAFRNCTNLTSVTIPDSVTSIGSSAFYGCNNLYDTNSILGVTLVDGWAIDHMSSLSGDLNLTGVRGIGSSAFYWCSGLVSVSIPGSVTSIGDQAFYSCRGLTSVTIPASVISIETCAFSGCSRLATAYVPNECSVGDDSFPSATTVYRYSPVQEVAFDMAGGTADVYSISVKYGDCYGTLPTPIRSGYSFNGWKYGSLDVDEDTIVTAFEDHTIVAQWTPNKYTIVFDANGGAGGTSNECDYGVAIIEPTVTRTGYAFMGWSPSVAATVPLGGATYTAQWEINQYVVTFDAAGGVGGTSSNQNYGTAIIVPTVTRTGYTFVGWSPEVSATVPAGDVTYTAQWTANQYSVAFDANGGDGGVTNDQDYASEIVAPTVTRTGYTFIGWSPEVSATVPASNVTYAAQWEINQYTVVFDAAGGVGGVTNKQDYASEIVAPTVMRTGYTFTGWSPEVPATVPAVDVTYTAQWQTNRYVVTLDVNGGVCETEELNIEYCSMIGDLPVPTRGKAVFLGWFTEADGGDEVAADFIVSEGMTIYAHWLTCAANPVISTDGGVLFRTDSCEVSISCETEGVVIYYTDDGTTPKKNNDYRYTGPITITETTTFKAVAVIGDVQSEYVVVTITKDLLTLEEAMNGGENVAIATSEAVPWIPILDDTAVSGGSSARSGAIGNRTNTWLSATVEGAGTMSFWCKVSCEHDEDGTFTWDRLMIYTNDVEIVEWRMDGETDWIERELSFEGGMNTVKWVYFKDRTGADGEDCAWVDGIVWTPRETIPGVSVDAAPAAVTNAIEAAGFADEAGVKAAVGGSAAEYAAFKAWAGSVKGVGSASGAVAGEAAVVANTNAAAAYLLGAERLFENAPKVEFGEVVVGKNGTQGTGGTDGTGTAISVAVTVRDGEEAVKCAAEKVATMFEATRDLGDWNGAAKLLPSVTVEEPAAGDSAETMRFKVAPGDGTAKQAFLRIRK